MVFLIWKVDDEMNKKKLIGSIIGIILFAILIAGATFALLASSSVIVTNGIYNATTVCFDIDYSNGGVIDGELYYLANPTTGLNTSITMGINSSCDISGTATIYLNVSEDVDGILINQVYPHCESEVNLSTLLDIADQTTCENNDNIWVTNGTALKYAVYSTNNPGVNTVPLSQGYINQSGDIAIYENIPLSEGSTTTYYIHIWLDGALATYEYSGKYFSGYFHTITTQT